jgi:hypothetical protein
MFYSENMHSQIEYNSTVKTFDLIRIKDQNEQIDIPWRREIH